MTTQTEGAVLEFGIGDRLRKAREWAGLTQVQLAADIDVHPNTIKNYEVEAGSKFRSDTIRHWAARCGVSEAWLLGGKPNDGLMVNIIGYSPFRYGADWDSAGAALLAEANRDGRGPDVAA